MAHNYLRQLSWFMLLYNYILTIYIYGFWGCNELVNGVYKPITGALRHYLVAVYYTDADIVNMHDNKR